jgi:hypothetical protein
VSAHHEILISKLYQPKPENQLGIIGLPAAAHGCKAGSKTRGFYYHLFFQIQAHFT